MKPALRSASEFAELHPVRAKVFTRFACGLAFGLTLLATAACQPAPAETPLPSPPPTVVTTATAAPTPTPTELSTPTITPTSESGGVVERLIPEIIASYDHDPASFTQGLVFDKGILYESAGEYGASDLREVDPQTGTVLRKVDLPDQYFAEGLALVNDELIQLTWRERTAFVYNLATFEERDPFAYESEGWGLCYDGTQLYLSDGSSTITLYDPQTFGPEGAITVTLSGQPVSRLNELECVGDFIYANVWHTDSILQIVKETGRVAAVIDASGLLTPEQERAAGSEGVLNGIAYDAETDHFYITGKRWPLMFEVRFVPAHS
jgi:glutaminyl-peptide cyclotransferase